MPAMGVRQVKSGACDVVGRVCVASAEEANCNRLSEHLDVKVVSRSVGISTR